MSLRPFSLLLMVLSSSFSRCCSDYIQQGTAVNLLLIVCVGGECSYVADSTVYYQC